MSARVFKVVDNKHVRRVNLDVIDLSLKLLREKLVATCQIQSSAQLFYKVG
mgnify:CR=1 FL=1